MEAVWRRYRERLRSRSSRLVKQLQGSRGTRAELDTLRQSTSEQLSELRALMEAQSERTLAALQLIYDDEPGNRRRLYALRQSEAYDAAYSDPEPLVSIPIATYSQVDLLRERALPSTLGQTYRNIEVIVVGDAAPPYAAETVARFDDPRVRYYNRTVRGPYPDDPHGLWHVAGTPPHNEAVAASAGAWIAPLDDDDAFSPDHVERLLEAARERRLEMCYGRLRCLMNDGSEFPLGEFPPRRGHFGLQGAIYHGGLRFFEMELADALFDSPNDWGVCRRMLRAGVRIGMIDDIVVDHYESKFHR